MEVLNETSPTFSPADSTLVQAVQRAGAAILGLRPTACLGAPATDARLWRLHGRPAVVYGPRGFNVGSIDENVTTDDLLAVCQVHTLAAYFFLAG